MIGRTLQVLLAQVGKPIIYRCAASGQALAFEPDAAVTPNGLLPAFLTAADAVWHEAVGRRFGLEVVVDPDSVLGFSVHGIRAGSFSTVMLSLMEVIAQIEQPDSLQANQLATVWTGATRRAELLWVHAAQRSKAA